MTLFLKKKRDGRSKREDKRTVITEREEELMSGFDVGGFLDLVVGYWERHQSDGVQFFVN